MPVTGRVSWARIDGGVRRGTDVLKALALGANVEISDLMGYFPLNPNEELTELGFSVASALFGEDQVVRETRWGTGCTDMGDIASVLPALHPYVAGAKGQGHGADYGIADPEKAVIASAKFQLALLCALLEDGGRRALRPPAIP